MFNSRETGQNRTAHGAIHNNCARVPCFPVSRPFTCATSCAGLWLFGSFLSSVFRFPCAIPNTVPAPFRLRFVHSVFHRSRGFLCFPCPSMVSCARPIYVGFNPHKAWGIIDARPVTAGRSCILCAVATFVAVSVLRWAYAMLPHGAQVVLYFAILVGVFQYCQRAGAAAGGSRYASFEIDAHRGRAKSPARRAAISV